MALAAPMRIRSRTLGMWPMSASIRYRGTCRNCVVLFCMVLFMLIRGVPTKPLEPKLALNSGSAWTGPADALQFFQKPFSRLRSPVCQYTEIAQEHLCTVIAREPGDVSAGVAGGAA